MHGIISLCIDRDDSIQHDIIASVGNYSMRIIAGETCLTITYNSMSDFIWKTNKINAIIEEARKK